MEYTKGEWTISETGFARFTSYGRKTTGARIFVTTAESDIVAEVQGDNITEAQANARLIAAAPEMYEALKKVKDYLRYGCHDKEEIIARALAKAEGK